MLRQQLFRRRTHAHHEGTLSRARQSALAAESAKYVLSCRMRSALLSLKPISSNDMTPALETTLRRFLEKLTAPSAAKTSKAMDVLNSPFVITLVADRDPTLTVDKNGERQIAVQTFQDGKVSWVQSELTDLEVLMR